MQAITTKYHGPTTTRGARISATTASGIGSMIPYPHELSGEECHIHAVRALCARLCWTGTLVSGEIKGGYVYVWMDYPPGVPVERIEVRS